MAHILRGRLLRGQGAQAITIAMGVVAGQHGPLECVVLYACSTVKMGRFLLQEGMQSDMRRASLNFSG